MDSLLLSLLSEKNKINPTWLNQLELWFLLLKQGVTVRGDWEGGQKADRHGHDC